ncbi:acyl-CoA thioesterase [Microbulbifer sp. TYP-18]|uniref:acyl-CoA thioesterase n=1 Tax=Microbulbifer sp. TYP-18 TaxID=3230024 RepID=UPI0034C63DF6
MRTNDGAFFEHSFITTFEQTNVVGNIYFANFVVWQGSCREMFIQEYCPDVLEKINSGLKLITLDVSCQYLDQLYAFDKVVMHMNIGVLGAEKMMLQFRYYKEDNSGERKLVCVGSQGTAAMQEINGKVRAVPFPDSMLDTIDSYDMIEK